jgi:DNA-binding NtrC family response regulator
MTDENLEIVVREKIKPIIDSATEKLIGVNIEKLSDDITSKLGRSSFLELDIDYGTNYAAAKKKFKRLYLTRILRLNLGNISEAAKAADIDRRSMHRMINELDINVEAIKKELVKPYLIKVEALSHMIEGVLDSYKQIIHPEKLKNAYSNIDSISEGIVDELPKTPLNLKEAEVEFEKNFFEKALKLGNGNIAAAARLTKVRYETMHRKLKALGIKKV